MSNYKEIVTKAIVGKAKKKDTNIYEMNTNNIIDTILGCWVINHNYTGFTNNNTVNINGSFDVNVWYSYDNNTKTEVTTNTYNYEEELKVSTKENNSDNEAIIRSLKQPTVIDVSKDNNNIKMTIEKELGVEILGNTKIKVPTEDLIDDYEDLTDNNEIDSIDTDYLK